MGSQYTILSDQHLEHISNEWQNFAFDVLVGLSEYPKRLPSRYFYDDYGSQLFEKIMDLPEYYLTRCEFDILEKSHEEISQLVRDVAFNLIELGAGDGRKTSLLIQQFLQEDATFDYYPIDISETAMKTLISSLNERFPRLTTHGIVAEYFKGIRWLRNLSKSKNLVLFLGSNLGNFNKPQARGFLRNLWTTLNNGDYVLIGFDLKKDIDLMQKAYNDSQGVTSEFNLNLLRRINRELGGNFDLSKFRHYASYDVFTGAMESYLVSQEQQTVFIKKIGQTFSFKAWEPIHTEYSYKYLESDIETLAEQTGYRIIKQLYDSRRYFIDSIWQVTKIDSIEEETGTKN